VLLLTFSRRAAQEIRRRAEGIVVAAVRSDAASQRPMRATATSLQWAGTFHSVASRLLRRFGPAVGLPVSFTVMELSDSEGLLNLVRNQLGMSERAKRFRRRCATCSAGSPRPPAFQLA
jgi:DNA helicase-2/ATP-dependent DNA helicase PcrA